MGCPVNQCKRINMYVDSQGIMRANKDLVKHYDAEQLPTLIGKPERVTAINARIKEDETKLTSNLEPVNGNSAVLNDGNNDLGIPCEHEFEGRICTKCGYKKPLTEGDYVAGGTVGEGETEGDYEAGGTIPASGE